MTLNAVIALILRFCTEFDRFLGRLYHSGRRETYNVRKILSPSSSFLLLAKTITHPAARGLSAIAEHLVTFSNWCIFSAVIYNKVNIKMTVFEKMVKSL